MKAAQPENTVRTSRTLLILAAALLGVLILSACPAEREANSGQAQAPVPEDGPATETAAADSDEADAFEAAADSADGASDTDGASADEQVLPPPEALVTEWELDGFKLGMSVREVRARLGPLLQGHLHENWVVEGETGMILAGTYAEPVNMQGSLLFLEGELVAVLASKLEEVHIFNQNFATLRAQLGETVGYLPEFARGRRFIDEMLAADPQPSPQYMWAQEATHSLYIIGYFEPDMLASYILLDADRYDDVAAEMEHGGAQGQ